VSHQLLQLSTQSSSVPFHGLLSGVLLAGGPGSRTLSTTFAAISLSTGQQHGIRRPAPARAVLCCAVLCCAVLCCAVLCCAGCRLLTADWSDRTVIHVELDLADSGMRFAAGDAVGVLPRNDPALVAGLLARLGVDGDAVFDVQAAGEHE